VFEVISFVKKRVSDEGEVRKFGPILTFALKNGGKMAKFAKPGST
jgi:hypothetical protein